MPITHWTPVNATCEWCGRQVLSMHSLHETHVQYMGGIFVGLRLNLCSQCIDMYEEQRSKLSSASTDPAEPWFKFGFADFTESCRHKMEELGIRFEVQYNLGQLSNVQVFFPKDLKVIKLTEEQYIYQSMQTHFWRLIMEDVLHLAQPDYRFEWGSRFDAVKPFSEMSPF